MTIHVEPRSAMLVHQRMDLRMHCLWQATFQIIDLHVRVQRSPKMQQAPLFLEARFST